MAEDSDVIRRVVDGDVDSFRLLVEKYEKPLCAMIANIISNRDNTEDIAQDVFLAAYRNLGRFDPARGRFSTLLFTIARNRCFNELKKKAVVVTNELPEKVDPRGPDDNLAEKELFERLDRSLAALPADQRIAFTLVVLVGLAYQEVSQIEGVPVGTVRSRVARAKQKLRLTLHSDYGAAG